MLDGACGRDHWTDNGPSDCLTENEVSMTHTPEIPRLSDVARVWVPSAAVWRCVVCRRDRGPTAGSGDPRSASGTNRVPGSLSVRRCVMNITHSLPRAEEPASAVPSNGIQHSSTSPSIIPQRAVEAAVLAPGHSGQVSTPGSIRRASHGRGPGPESGDQQIAPARTSAPVSEARTADGEIAVRGQVNHFLSELPLTIEGMEHAFKACLARRVDAQA